MVYRADVGQEFDEQKKEITVKLGVWSGVERKEKERVALGLQGSWLLPWAPCNPKKSGNVIIHHTQPRLYLLPQMAIFVNTGLGRKRLVFMYSEIFFRPSKREMKSFRLGNASRHLGSNTWFLSRTS